MSRTPQAEQAAPPEPSSRAVTRRATALAGLGSVADVAAVAQLVTTGSASGVLVAGLLSVLAGFLGLVQLAGRPVGRGAAAMALVIAIGAGMAGAAVQAYWTGGGTTTPPSTTAATTKAHPTTTASTSTGAATPGSASTAPVTTAGSGEVVRTGTASLRDQDYLDVETGVIGEVKPGASDLWYVGGYRELWTAGGGEQPIAPITGQPDAAACADELARRGYDQVAIGPMSPGAWVCARTAEDNVVAVQVTAIPTGDQPLAITYTVWHK
ncbi:hypothetical protein ABTZ99_13795 [Actinosynnema sp. NPDC002837]